MMNRDERQRARDEAIRNRPKSRPTPTQEEADLKALGVPADEIVKQPDGSGPDPHVEKNREMMSREMRPERPQGKGYVTRGSG